MDENDEISLRALVLLLWRDKWIVICTTIVCGAIAALVAWKLPPKYDAVSILSPVTNSAGAGHLAEQASGLGGLASLIGINLGGDTNRAESIAVLESELLTERYVQENNLLPVLFADKWDPVGKTWRATPAEDMPTLWKANKMFEKIRIVTEDKKSGLVTLTVRWKDPAVAAKWANDLVRLTNDYLRAKAIRESERHIAYLKDQATNTDLAQVRTAIYTVLESEIKNVMLAKGPGDYALKVIDPAFPPETRSSPKIAFWVLGGIAAGLFLSFMVLFLRAAWRAEPSR